MGIDINKMQPELLEKYLLFKQKMTEVKIDFKITCVDRNITEQMALYVQGRLPMKDVNRFRKAAGLYLFKSDTENKSVVTWTLESKHITNNLVNGTYNTLSRAFDIAIIKDGKVTWDIKEYDKAGPIGESVGLKWGGRFSSPDRPHFEI